LDRDPVAPEDAGVTVGQHLLEDLGGQRVGCLPTDVETRRHRRAGRLRTAGVQRRGLQRVVQRLAEVEALGAGEPSPRPETGDEDHDVGRMGDERFGALSELGLLGEGQRSDGGAVDDASAPAFEQLGLFLPTTIRRDADGVARQRPERGRGDHRLLGGGTGGFALPQGHVVIVTEPCFGAVSPRFPTSEASGTSV
jgi:hypothetical protein